MWIILGILIGSIILGFLLRDILNEGLLNKLLLYSIFLLLFLMGVNLGSNDKILNSLPILGLRSILLAIGAIWGSVLISWFIYKKWFKS